MVSETLLPEDLSLRDILRLVVLFVVYYVLFQFYVHFLLEFFPEFSQEIPYFSFSIILTSVNKLGAFLAYVILLTIFLVTYFRTDWNSLGLSETKIRYLITFLGIVLAWSYSAYGYNYFLNQGHYLDRLIVISFALLTFLHPSYSTLLLGSATIVGSQLNQGMFILREVEERLLLSILIMFVAYLLVRSFSDSDEHECLFGIFVVTASNYFGPGLVKIINGDNFFDWFYYYNLVYDFAWHYHVGWLSDFPQWIIDGIILFLTNFNTPILLLILIIELSALLLLLDNRMTIAILAGFCLLHVGFLFISGVLFAKWLIVLFAVILLFSQLEEELLKEFYRRYRLVFPVFLILVTISGLVPSRNIVWGGTKYNIAFDMVGISNRGEKYLLSERSFPPYGRYFSQSYVNFSFLIRDEKILGPSYINFRVAGKLNALLTSPDQVEPVKKRIGFDPYNARRAKYFGRFLRTYLSNYYQNDQSRPFYYLQYPVRYLATMSSEKHFPYQIPGRIKKVNIRLREAYFNGVRNILLESKVIKSVDIPK